MNWIFFSFIKFYFKSIEHHSHSMSAVLPKIQVPGNFYISLSTESYFVSQEIRSPVRSLSFFRLEHFHFSLVVI